MENLLIHKKKLKMKKNISAEMLDKELNKIWICYGSIPKWNLNYNFS